MNLLTLKNKKIYALGIILFIGLIAISLFEMNMPEGEKSPSGSSINRRTLLYIDNNRSVLDYEYRYQSKKHRKYYEYTLSEKNYTFLDEIDFLSDEEFPQGLCITDEYVFISTYSESKERLGELKIFDRMSGVHLISLGVDENSHLGGVAYDGEYIWICNSYKKTLERISYEFIKQMILDNLGAQIDVRNQVEVYKIKNRPSSVSFYKGYLMVASHSISGPGNMIGYVYNQEKDTLEAVLSFQIPQKVQGVTFTEQGEVIVSASYGRRSSSYIKIYNSLLAMNHDVKNYKECIELPPCSEGVFYWDKNIYVLFESAAKKYLEGTDGRGESFSPINKILLIKK